MAVELGKWVAKTQSNVHNSKREGLWKGLVLGEKAVGKTSCIETMPRPWLIDAFEPGLPPVVRKAVDDGDCIVRLYTCDSDGYKRFTASVKEVLRYDAGDCVLNHFGTWCIDTLTMLSDALRDWVWKTKITQAKAKWRGVPAEFNEDDVPWDTTDWDPMKIQTSKISNAILSAPCHVLLLGHLHKPFVALTPGKDPRPTLGYQGGGRETLLALVPEVYVLTHRQASKKEREEKKVRGLCSDGNIREFETARSEDYIASTKEKIPAITSANVGLIMSKTGKDCKDKPRLDGKKREEEQKVENVEDKKA